MARDSLVKIKAGKAADICLLVTLEKESRSLLDDKISPAVYLERLQNSGAHIDAIRFLAYALPKREAVWWACLAARSSLPPEPEPPLVEALKAAEAWVLKPTEENRRAALAIGEKVGAGSSPGWTALAAGWTGGSMGPADGPAIAPGDNLTPSAVSVAIIEAALAEGAEVHARFRTFLTQGLDIASGGTGRLSPNPA